MTMTQLSPEALAGLVERLNRLTPAGRDFRTTEIHSAIHEAAAAILALEAQVGDLTLQRDTARMAADALKANPPTIVVSGRHWTDRATRAEAMLREIASTVEQTATIDHLHCKLALDRIAALARSLTAPVEKEKE